MTGANNSTAILDTTDNLPFPLWFVNRTRTVSTAGNASTATVTADVVVRPQATAAPGQRTNTFYVVLPRTSIEHQVDYAVAEVRNWTVSRQNVTGNVSVDSGGRFGTYRVAQHGNAEQELTANITGNISTILSVDDEFDLPAETPKQLRVQYEVPRSTPFGNYSGTLNISDGNVSRPMNLSVYVADDLQPEIVSDLDVGEVMATTSTEIELLVADNLEVAAVSADVVRERTVQRNNTTVTENVSVGRYQFEHAPRTERWTLTFDDTSEIGQYYLNVSARDAANNSVSVLDALEVVGLDAVTVGAEDFQFESDRPDATLTEPVFEITEETPLNVTLESFSTSPANMSMIIGVTRADQASAETFDGAGDTITVVEPGMYELEVTTSEKGQFNGKLVYEPVPQHYALPDTGFSGQFVDPTCPKEATYESGEHTFDFGYTDGGCVNGEVKLVITAPGEQCKGYSDPSNCVNIKGADFGRISALEDKVSTKQMLALAAIGIGGFVAFLFSALWWFDRRVWPYLDYELVKEAD